VQCCCKTMVCKTNAPWLLLNSNASSVGLARTIYIRCLYGIFGREITKYMVIYGVYIRFWPTLLICSHTNAGKAKLYRCCPRLVVPCCPEWSCRTDKNPRQYLRKRSHFDTRYPKTPHLPQWKRKAAST